MKVLRMSSVMLLVAAEGILVGCGGGDGGDDANKTSSTKSTATPAVAGAVTVSMKEYSFSPDRLELRRGATIGVANDGQIAHNLTIEKGSNPDKESPKVAGTSTFGPGQDERLKVDLSPGTYAIACTVPGHRDQGMKGTITVK